ncbi:sensor histidine kinase [Desulfohalovibrio reitneri]|uniref:sensor histidine kinase n=1 Tax=Desulfohalovibrio reitneri TaxID=1307759 RepID=UPI00068B8A7B|nr:ATP-binding protein [Desulfohalovibrio reitneri]
MTIRGKLRLLGLLALAQAVLLLGLFLWVQTREASYTRMRDVSMDIVMACSNLNRLAFEADPQNLRRVTNQWRVLHGRVLDLTARYQRVSREVGQDVEAIRDTLGKADAVFKQASRAIDTGIPGQEFRLSMVSFFTQQTESVAKHLAARAEALSKRSKQTSFLATVMAIAVFGLSLLVLVHRIGISIQRPIEALRDDMRRMTYADENHRARVISDDEMGELARDCNAMVDRLREMTVSMDSLTEESRLRRQSEQKVRRLISMLLRNSERERKALGSELHDGVVQSLVGAGLILEEQAQVAKLKDEEIDPRRLALASDVIKEQVRELRRLIMDLRPTVLDDLGLDQALHWLCRQYATNYPDTEYEYMPEEELPPVPDDAAACLFRVAQEALSNGTRHGLASHIDIKVWSEDHMLNLEVRDDGQGFDQTDVDRGHGLAIMRERLELLGGDLVLDSEPGEGTSLRATVPLA